MQALDAVFNESDALEWADGFEFAPHHVKDGSELFLNHGGDLPSMVRYKQALLAQDRLNAHRVDTWLSVDNPEFDKMMELATTGMPVFRSDDFVPNVGNGCVPQLRATYKIIAPAVHRLLSESTLDKGLAFLLPKEMALSVPGVHLSLNSWAPKQGKLPA